MPVVEIDSDLCENSQTCEAVCPEDVFAIENGLVKVVSSADCTLCWKCVENCSSGAIRLDD
ncbi:MAG: 4Fe-4S dicluster domain-containing protein [Acidobacteria bacterium]|nr:MAG: 4Fe-4S dicluster domain-containing protein [Acidobacteriota bacterium]